MKWNSVKKRLPKEGRYLCIVAVYKKPEEHGSLISILEEVVMEAFFNPANGWRLLTPEWNNFEIKYWIRLPTFPLDAVT